MEVLKPIFDKYNVDDGYREPLLRLLTEKKIIILCDNSGSMGITDPDSTKSRLEHQKEIVMIIVEMILALGEPLNLQFINKGKVSYNNLQDIETALSTDVSGKTPLTSALRNIIYTNYMNPGQVLVLISVDGKPSDVSGEYFIEPTIHFKQTIEYRNPLMRVSFLICTNDKSEVEYLYEIDPVRYNIDLIDNYETEKKKITGHFNHATYTIGDHAARYLLGSMIQSNQSDSPASSNDSIQSIRLTPDQSDIDTSDHRSDHKSDHTSDHTSDHKSDHRSDHRSDNKSDYISNGSTFDLSTSDVSSTHSINKKIHRITEPSIKDHSNKKSCIIM